MKPFTTIYDARLFASYAHGPVSLNLYVPPVPALGLVDKGLTHSDVFLPSRVALCLP